MKFGKILKSLLDENNLSQSTFADAIGYTQRAVSKWVNEQSEPSEMAIIRTADFFQLSTDYLLGRTDEYGIGAMPENNAIRLSIREQEVLDLFNKMSPSLQNRFIGFGEGLIGMKESAKL